MKLRKIVYTPAKGWIASFHGKQIEKDGRKTYEPDVKVRADSYEELMRELIGIDKSDNADPSTTVWHSVRL